MQQQSQQSIKSNPFHAIQFNPMQFHSIPLQIQMSVVFMMTFNCVNGCDCQMANSNLEISIVVKSWHLIPPNKSIANMKMENVLVMYVKKLEPTIQRNATQKSQNERTLATCLQNFKFQKQNTTYVTCKFTVFLKYRHRITSPMHFWCCC